MIHPTLTPFQRHVLIGQAIRMRGGAATVRQIGEATGLDLTRVSADLVDMHRERTVERLDNGGWKAGRHHHGKTGRYIWKLASS